MTGARPTKADWTHCLDCGAGLVQRPGRGAPRIRCDSCWGENHNANNRLGGVARRCPACELPPAPGCIYCQDHRYSGAGFPTPAPALPACAICGEGQVTAKGAIYCSPACRREAVRRSNRIGNQDEVRAGRQRDRWKRKRESTADRPTKHPQWRRVRLAVFADRPPCGICLGPIDYALKFPDPMSPSVDHIVSWRRGGAWFDLANLQAAHFGCNAGKREDVAS